MIDSPLVNKLIRLAIAEDYSFGDVTSKLSVPKSATCKASIIAREPLVICGLDLIEKIFSEFGWQPDVKVLAKDGQKCRSGDILAKIAGNAREILAAERTILNFLQHLSGVATLTRKVVDKNKGLVILDTRKTTPGLRVLEKYAVAIGGAHNHRGHLGDMILLKNNHIDIHAKASKSKASLSQLIRHIKNAKPPYMDFEVEVRTLEELSEVLREDPQIIMLDNMSDPTVKRAVKLIRAHSPKCFIEVSGGVTEKRLKKLKALGVDGVSMGMLTRSATMVDISLRIA
jgi:nicotinate-nucleotide pyrophosphorylase (carboxylating)